MNYLSVCDTAIGNGSEEAAAAATGIRAVIVGQQAEFLLEYSCNSPFAERWFMLRVTPFAESVPRRVVVAHVNITERKRAEVALQESYHTLEQRVNERTAELQAAKERVEAILNNSTDGILLIDTDLKIQQTNASFNSLFGCEWDDYVGKSLVTLIIVEDADKVTKLIQTVVAEPHGKRIEIQALRKDGKVFDAELSTRLIKDDGLVCSIRDITERKAQERHLRYHASIQESVSDAVIATDMDFRIQSWNRAAEAIYGWSAAEAIGKPVNEIVQTTYGSEADRARILQNFLERGAWQGEVIQRHRDGSPINILASVNLFKDDLGQPFGVVSVNRDITERKRADDALRESEDRFRRAIVDAPFPIMIHAEGGEVLHISSAWTEISGYTHAEIPTMTDWVDKAYRENSPIVKDVIDKLYSLTGAQRNGEFRIWTKSGEERVWDFVSAPLALMPDGRRMVSSMAMDITERKHAEETLQKKMEEERQFQSRLKALHEVIIGLTAIDELDAFYKRAVELGRERLGFERLAMFLYDDRDGNAVGTFGTDTLGNLSDERGVRFKPDPNGIMQRSFERAEGFYVNEQSTLYSAEVPVGQGWNAAAVLWNGTRSLGWFVADNLLSHVPASKTLLDVLGLYALSVGTLLAQKQTQIALRESEGLYRLLAENINDLVMRSTLTGECLYISPSVQTLLGYIPEELIGQQTFNLIHPDDKSTIREAYASALEQHDLIMPHQYRARHKDGHYVWLETVGKPLFSETSDEVLGVITSSRNITARRQSEEALRQSQQMLSNVIENIPVRLFWKDRNSVYRGCNTLHARGNGMTTPDEIIGKTDFDFYPERAAAWGAEDREVMTSGQAILDVEELVDHKDGSAHWLRSNRVPLRSADGEVTGVLVTLEDITKRKEQERQLRFYASIQASVTDAVVATDLNFRIQSWNRAAEQMYGWHAEEVIGRFSGEILQTQFLSGATREQAMQTLQEQGYVVGEAIQRHKDGRTIYTFGSVMLIKDETRLPIGFVAVNHDITKNKQAEEALQQALVKEKELGDLKTRFVSMASHEFRNPLATILATTDTLSAYRHKLTEEQIEQRFDKIKEQVGHLKDIMEDVLMLARMQARRVEFNPVKLDLDALVRSVLDEFESRPDIRHKLAYTVGEGNHEIVLDRKLMRQIINNLVSNAIKYSPEGKVIRINLEYTASEVILKISDEGIGIPEADLPHLFEPFHRAANVGTISGTGLGLVITREAVELHSGTIAVESQQGVGTTFLIRIPISIGG
jgi:PAS domain S-box-containing protein